MVPWTKGTNATGDVVNLASLAAGATAAPVVKDWSNCWQVLLQPAVTFGAISATNGLRMNIYQVVGGSGTIADGTALLAPSVVATVASSTVVGLTVRLQPGIYSIVLQNLDTTNAVTNATVTSMVFS